MLDCWSVSPPLTRIRSLTFCLALLPTFERGGGEGAKGRRMGKYVTKCSKGVRELAVTEVTQVVGVRTRARALALAASAAAVVPRRRKAAAAAPELVQTSSYLQLRSRRLVMRSRRDQAHAPAPENFPVLSSPALAEEVASLCSSNTSSELVVDEQADKDLESSTCNFDSERERREATPSSEARGEVEAGQLESTAGATSTSRAARATPTEAEIEDFFSEAQREQAKRFADRYNYDVINDVPLDGRFLWVRMY